MIHGSASCGGKFGGGAANMRQAKIRVNVGAGSIPRRGFSLLGSHLAEIGARVGSPVGPSRLLLAFAVAAVTFEFMNWIDSGEWRVFASGDLWFMLDRQSLDLAQAATQ